MEGKGVSVGDEGRRLMLGRGKGVGGRGGEGGLERGSMSMAEIY